MRKLFFLLPLIVLLFGACGEDNAGTRAKSDYIIEITGPEHTLYNDIHRQFPNARDIIVLKESRSPDYYRFHNGDEICTGQVNDVDVELMVDEPYCREYAG